LLRAHAAGECFPPPHNPRRLQQFCLRPRAVSKLPPLLARTTDYGFPPVTGQPRVAASLFVSPPVAVHRWAC
jgi:hypothetical protein